MDATEQTEYMEVYVNELTKCVNMVLTKILSDKIQEKIDAGGDSYTWQVSNSRITSRAIIAFHASLAGIFNLAALPYIQLTPSEGEAVLLITRLAKLQLPFKVDVPEDMEKLFKLIRNLAMYGISSCNTDGMRPDEKEIVDSIGAEVGTDGFLNLLAVAKIISDAFIPKLAELLKDPQKVARLERLGVFTVNKPAEH